MIPLLAGVWLLSVQPARAQYPGGTPNDYPGSNTDYANNGQPPTANPGGSGSGSNTGSNTGYPGSTGGGNTGYPGGGTGPGLGDGPSSGPGGQNNSGTGSNTGYPGGGTSGNNSGSSTGYPGGNTGSNTGYPGSTGGSNTGYPGGGNDGGNTGGNGTDGGDTGGSGTGGGTITPGHWDVSYSSQGTTDWHYAWYDADYKRIAKSDTRQWPATGSGDGVSSNYYLDAKTKGTVTATLTWVPTTGQDAASDPPSSSVIVTETGYASEAGGGSGTGKADDGWGDPAGGGGSPGSSSGGSSSGASSSGTHYEVKDGSSGSITITKTLSASTPDNTTPDANGDFSAVGAMVSVFLAVGGANPTITLGGAIPDSNKKQNILVGQGCTASLNTPPFDATKQSGWTWTISGTTFQDWQPATPANPKASSFVDGPGPLTNSTAHWYWNDSAATDETVTCTATVTPTDGKTAPFTVNVTQNVTVQVPSWTAFGIGGYVQVNSDCPDETLGLVALWAGPYVSPTGSYDTHHGGMDWTATCTTPQKPVAFGTGTLELVQLATPNRSYTTNTAPPVSHTQQAAKGLDSRYPYPSLSPSAYVEGGPAYGAFDDPRMPTDGVNAKSVSMAESFDDYLLYQPPGTDVRWVPLANFTWSTDTTNGSVTIPKSGFWVDYSVSGTPSDKAGTVYVAGKPCTAPPTKINFTPWHTHPKWTLINTFPAF